MTAGNLVSGLDVEACNGGRALTASAVEAISYSQISPINDTENGYRTTDDTIKEQDAYIRLLKQKQLNLRKMKRDPGFLDIGLPLCSYKKHRTSQVLKLHEETEFAEDNTLNIDNWKPIIKQEQSISPERHIKIDPELLDVTNSLLTDLNCETKRENSIASQKVIKSELGKKTFVKILADNSPGNPIVIDDDDDGDLILLEKEAGPKQGSCSIAIDSPHTELNGSNGKSPKRIIKVEPGDTWIEATQRNTSSSNPTVFIDEDDKNIIAIEKMATCDTEDLMQIEFEDASGVSVAACKKVLLQYQKQSNRPLIQTKLNDSISTFDRIEKNRSIEPVFPLTIEAHYTEPNVSSSGIDIKEKSRQQLSDNATHAASPQLEMALSSESVCGKGGELSGQKDHGANALTKVLDEHMKPRIADKTLLSPDSTKPSNASKFSIEYDAEDTAERVLKDDSAAEQTALGREVTEEDREGKKGKGLERQSVEEESVFVGSSDTEDQCNIQPKKKGRKAYKPNVKKVPKIREATLKSSMDIGLQFITEMHEPRKGPRRSGAVDLLANNRDRSYEKVNQGKGCNGSQRGIDWTNIIFKDIGKNLDVSDEPYFTSPTREEAFKQMKAKLDLSKPANVRDLKALERAWEEFHGKASVKSDGNGQWSVKGMISSLRSYQLFGVAFIRRRENGSTSPRGGLNADVMGLGKTVMMLANIVNDKLGINPHGRKTNKTTLVVTTAGLVTQWSDEIKNHCEREYAGKVIIYRGGSKTHSHDTKELLQEHDIIVTTYYEVMRSYPAVKPPPDYRSLESKQTWWRNEFEVNRGVLHDIYFRRIVLDEAAVIKNYAGRTSMACQALMGKFRWALTGTPIQNTPLELYPIFKFLQLPHARTVEMFRRNYLNERGSTSVSRLRAILDPITLRRTHMDRFLDKPLLPLKSAREKTYIATFNDFERSIYNLMMQNMQRKLNEIIKKGDSRGQVITIFTMLIRLRQMTSHILLARGVILDFLVKKNITILRTLAKKMARVEDCGEQMYQIRQMLAEAETIDMKKSISNCRSARKDAEEMESECMEALDPSEDAEDGNPQRYDARHFINQLQETRKRRIQEEEEGKEPTAGVRHCDLCKTVAEKPFITDCNHVICSECFSNFQENSFGELADRFECIHCGADCTIEQLHGNDEGQNRPDKRKGRRGQDRNSDNDIRNWIERSPYFPSAKVLAVMGQIKNWWKKDPDAKIIVYTHFIDMIEILGHMCRAEKWEYCEYHGKQTLKNRDKALKIFEDNYNIGILLMSIKCGGLGLNITIASRVIIVDPWWNSAVEEQAFCRVFRHGQAKATTMTRIVVSGSVDEKMLELQANKRKKIDHIMSNDEYAPKPSLEELVSLFRPIEDPHDKEGFEYDFRPTDAICWTSDDEEEICSETINTV